MDNIEFFDLFESNDVIIIDDLLFLTPELIQFLKYTVHHKNLIVFLITQNLIGDKLFALTYLIHNIVLILRSSAAVRIALELLQRFFIANDTKLYLKNIISKAEREKSIISLKLNSVASYKGLGSKILCFSNLEHLVKDNFCLAFPELGFMDQFEGLNFDPNTLDQNQLVLVPAKYIIRKPKIENSCSKEAQWADMVTSLNQDIESNFPYKKWNICKALTREMLKNEDICISADFRLILLKDKPYQIPFIDFLHVASRKQGPSEMIVNYLQFVPLMQVLLKNNLPQTLIINKMLLDSAINKRSRSQSGFSQKSTSARHQYGKLL